MKNESLNIPSSEEMAKIEKERTLSDADLLKGGAEYKVDKERNKILEATNEQIKKAKKEMLIEKGFPIKSIKDDDTYPDHKILELEGINVLYIVNKKVMEERKIKEDDVIKLTPYYIAYEAYDQNKRIGDGKKMVSLPKDGFEKTTE